MNRRGTIGFDTLPYVCVDLLGNIIPSSTPQRWAAPFQQSAWTSPLPRRCRGGWWGHHRRWHRPGKSGDFLLRLLSDMLKIFWSQVVFRFGLIQTLFRITFVSTFTKTSCFVVFLFQIGMRRTFFAPSLVLHMLASTSSNPFPKS